MKGLEKNLREFGGRSVTDCFRQLLYFKQLGVVEENLRTEMQFHMLAPTLPQSPNDVGPNIGKGFPRLTGLRSQLY